MGYTVTLTPRGVQAVAMQVTDQHAAVRLLDYLLTNLEPTSLAHLTVARNPEMPRTGSQKPVEAPCESVTASDTPEPEPTPNVFNSALAYRVVPLIDGDKNSIVVGPKGCSCEANVFRGTPCIHYQNYEKGMYELDTDKYPRANLTAFTKAREQTQRTKVSS